MVTVLDGPSPGLGFLVINPGRASETRVPLGSSRCPIVSYRVGLTTGAEAQKLSMTLLDESGHVWPLLSWGARLKFNLRGTVVFNGKAVMPSVRKHPGGVLVELTAVGGNATIYEEAAQADEEYVDQTTAFIAKDLIDTHFAGRLTSTGINAADGVTVGSFEVTEGENIGDVLERLNKLDGFTFEVDETDDVRYYEISTTPQDTITVDDLRGDPDEVVVDLGAVPPRNIVRIQGGSGYAEQLEQEARDSWYTFDATGKRLAQRFTALTDRLSSIQVGLDRTLDPNKPGSLGVGIYKNGYDEAPTATFSGTVSGVSSISNASNVKDENEATHCDVTLASGASAFFVFDLGSARTIRGWRSHILKNDPATTMVVSLRWSDDGASYTSLDSWSTAGSVERTETRMVAETSHRYWQVQIDASGGPLDMDVYTLNVLSSAAPGVNQSYPCYDTAGTYKVEWSDDVSITASDLPYPSIQTMCNEKRYTSPKLALTEGESYWLVLTASSDASGTKYWKGGYYAASSVYSGGVLKSSSDSGATWSALNHDLTFNLYWTEDSVDITRTNARSTLTSGITDAQNTIPVAELRDFPASGTVTIDSEDITYTGRSASSGAGNLTGATRGANSTAAAAHLSGRYVNAESVRLHGPAPHQEPRDDRITTVADAEAIASVILDKHSEPLPRARLPLLDLRPDLRPRAVVTWKHPSLGISGDYELAEVEHVLEEGATEPYTIVQIGAREYNAARAIEVLRKEV